MGDHVIGELAERRLDPYTLTVREGQSERLGPFECEFFAVNHSIPDALAVAIRTGAGLVLSGQSPDGRLVEMIELPEHPFFVAGQFHPELKSRPNRAHPLFREFIGAAKKYAK